MGLGDEFGGLPVRISYFRVSPRKGDLLGRNPRTRTSIEKSSLMR